MCLALPAEIVALDADGASGTVAIAGIRKRISLALIEAPRIGEYVLIHVGFALHKVSAEEAERTLQLMAELDLATEITGDEAATEAV